MEPKSESSYAPEEEVDTRFNFRALLRKTGQDLTSGNTLSRRSRSEAEPQQIDFRKVLKNRNKAPSIENLKLTHRLVPTH